jgi:hypothetical protein
MPESDMMMAPPRIELIALLSSTLSTMRKRESLNSSSALSSTSFTSDGLVLVDVSQTTATRVGVLPPSPGASLTCPVWHIDGSAFVYTDLGDTDSRLHRVEWGNSAPSAPELLYESAGEIRAQIFGP